MGAYCSVKVDVPESVLKRQQKKSSDGEKKLKTLKVKEKVIFVCYDTTDYARCGYRFLSFFHF